jgi:hypothetical protein
VEEEVAFLLEVEKVEVVVLEQHSSNPLLRNCSLVEVVVVVG